MHLYIDKASFFITISGIIRRTWDINYFIQVDKDAVGSFEALGFTLKVYSDGTIKREGARPGISCNVDKDVVSFAMVVAPSK